MSATQAPATPTDRSGFFARKSSGLVRDISLVSAVALNVSFISIVYAVLGATTVPFAFPGASMLLSPLLCALACVFPYLLYSYFSKVMPRSGGDYVFVSRSIHPWVGLAASINGWLWFVFALTYASFLTVQFALSATFGAIGTIADSHTLITMSTDVLKHGWTFALAFVLMVLCFVTVSVRMPITLKITQVLFYISVIGTVVAAVVLLFGSRADFRSAVADAGADYAKVIRDSESAGYTPAGFNIGSTLLSMAVPFYALGFGIATAYVGGEIRGGKDIATRGKLYALALGGVAMTIIFALSSGVLGDDFLGGATLMSNTFDANYPFSAPSNIFFFISLLSGSSIVAVILGITFLASAIAVMIPTFLIASRSLFAWSFDRLVPEKLSEVDERTRAPLIANVIALAVGTIFLVVLVFGPSTLVTVASTQILGLTLTFLVVAIAGIVFPYRRPYIYRGSPVDRSVAGLPLMSLIGVGALLVWGFFAIAILTNDALAATQTVGLVALIAFVVIGVVAYPVLYALNQRRGIDISLASRELPPE